MGTNQYKVEEAQEDVDDCRDNPANGSLVDVNGLDDFKDLLEVWTAIDSSTHLDDYLKVRLDLDHMRYILLNRYWNTESQDSILYLLRLDPAPSAKRLLFGHWARRDQLDSAEAALNNMILYTDDDSLFYEFQHFNLDRIAASVSYKPTQADYNQLTAWVEKDLPSSGYPLSVLIEDYGVDDDDYPVPPSPIPCDAELRLKNPDEIIAEGASPIKTYPNPFNDALIVESTNDVAIVSWTLMYASGRYELADHHSSAFQVVVNTSTVPSGLYILQVRLENGQQHYQKVIKP